MVVLIQTEIIQMTIHKYPLDWDRIKKTKKYIPVNLARKCK